MNQMIQHKEVFTTRAVMRAKGHIIARAALDSFVFAPSGR
jgi:hypothetical protein